MALAQPPQPMQDRRRVKVYELKNNDWFDRGTGFCAGHIVVSAQAPTDQPDARIVVHSEDDPNRTLLETRILKEDGYQKQQDTLIVWTEELTGTDMALSFQEAEGCGAIWDFVSDVHSRLAALAQEDGVSDDPSELLNSVVLPEPQLGNLDEIENAMRNAAMHQGGREALIKFIINPEHMYILKLTPLVSMAEDLEALGDLHRLCTIMKHLILLNDNQIIEFIVTDEAIMGVVGALEYDPDFPSHRANHRQYLSDSSKFKEVVKIDREEIRKKIHYTYRLLYLKDVVLARILDDPTFSVLNSLIFFHQVDIVNHLQQSQSFLTELFAIFGDEEKDQNRKKEGVLFIQNCCAVSKNIQAQSRAQLFQNFIHHGLFAVITFALRHHDAAVRVAGTDILVALIDHDPHLVRSQIFTSIRERTTPLTDTLIELLLVEVDLGVKSQMADAIKILLDPSVSNVMDAMSRQGNSEFAAKQRAGMNHSAPQTEAFIQSFYDDSANRLFAPLKALEHRPSMLDLTVHETSLFTHLVEVLCFFVRQHSHKSKLFILSENLHCRVAQLLQCPQKYMKLTALKWFRTCVGLQDEFHNRHIVQSQLLEPILGIVEATMPRDNLLNSACLELFEYIKRESIKQLVVYLVESYRERMVAITYVNTFQALVSKYDQLQGVYGPTEDSSFTTQEGTPHHMMNGQRFQGLRDMDSEEEAYFNADDDEEEDDHPGLPSSRKHAMVNGASPVRPLVNYPLDEDEDAMDILQASPLKEKQSSSDGDQIAPDAMDVEGMDLDAARDSMPLETEPDAEPEEERGRNRTPVSLSDVAGRRTITPPESVLMKRRRDEEDDGDELDKMMSGSKRRNSAASISSQTGKVNLNSSGSPTAPSDADRVNVHEDENENPLTRINSSPGHGHMLRRKGSLKTKNETPAALRHAKFSIKPISITTDTDREPPFEDVEGGEADTREHSDEKHEASTPSDNTDDKPADTPHTDEDIKGEGEGDEHTRAGAETATTKG